MRISSVLNKAVQQEYHFIPLKFIFSYYIQQFLKPVLQEVYLSLNRVLIQDFISDLRKSLHNLIENVLPFSGIRLIFTLIPIFPIDSQGGVRVP